MRICYAGAKESTLRETVVVATRPLSDRQSNFFAVPCGYRSAIAVWEIARKGIRRKSADPLMFLADARIKFASQGTGISRNEYVLIRDDLEQVSVE